MDFCIGIDIGSQKTILVDQSADIVLTDTGKSTFLLSIFVHFCSPSSLKHICILTCKHLKALFTIRICHETHSHLIQWQESSAGRGGHSPNIQRLHSHQLQPPSRQIFAGNSVLLPLPSPQDEVLKEGNC